MSKVIEANVVVQRARFRDESGRFVSDVEQGSMNAARELANKLGALTIVNIAHMLRVRTGDLISSVEAHPISAYTAEAVVKSDHAAPLEKGARPHPIPNAFGWGVTVQHPGNRPYRFMELAGQQVAGMALAIIRRRLPS